MGRISGENMKRILVATHNPSKLKEFKDIFAQYPVDLISLADLSDLAEVVEDGTTFSDNARLKAIYFAKKHRLTTVADDSGLVIDALDGQPGIFSARYSGKGDQANNVKVLKEMQDVSKRSAHFMTSIALCTPKGDCRIYQGRIDGTIAYEQKGVKGFGYDPIFIPESYDKTFAELGEAVKNKISHRAIALNKLKENLDDAITDK
jgi:non-canonical purine NTP pyrophosphatase (RdgB/HAM1 family)